ncbi:MAG: hypothetical protein JWP96_895 [Polaromonas sp.]|nr:hypothetical protein [Polaromonas sp.]
MKNRVPKTIFSCLSGALLGAPSHAQDILANAPEIARAPWKLSAMASEASLGHGVPVLALDRPDWPSYLSGSVAHPRAWRTLQAELGATHPSGWRFGALARAEASLQASPDAVTAAALEATSSEPDINRRYELNAHSQSWQGRGIRVGTPWLALDKPARWHWQADAQLLRLQQFRTVDLSGNVSYQGGGVYDFKVQSQRSNPGLTGPFLPASGRAGLGSSLSIALKGEPAPGWQVQLRANDLLSKLTWSNLATDTAMLDSQVTSRTADGSLDYAPLVKGQQALMRVTGRIGVHWQATVSRAVFTSGDDSRTITLRVDRKAGLNQSWVGWKNGDAEQNRFHWRVEVEPVRRAASLGLAWKGWHAALATDGKGTGSELRALNLGWQADF